MSKLDANEYKQFENNKQIQDNGTGYWLARELAPVLDYTE